MNNLNEKRFIIFMNTKQLTKIGSYVGSTKCNSKTDTISPR